MSPWPLHGRGAGKTNESGCNSAARSLDLPDKRDCGRVPQFLQAPDMHKLFLITGFISFLPKPSSNLHLSKCFQVRAKPKSIPGVQGNPERLFRSRSCARKQNYPLGPAAWFSCSFPYLEQFRSPTPNIGHMAWKRKYLNEWALLEWLLILCFLQQLWQVRVCGRVLGDHWELRGILHSLGFSTYPAVRIQLNMCENTKA